MAPQVEVFKGRTTVLSASLGYDVSEDEFTSEIRERSDNTSPLIASWDVAFLNDGTDGELVLTLDDNARTITKSIGYMDLKRQTGSGSVPVFDEVLEVLFKDTVTE